MKNSILEGILNYSLYRFSVNSSLDKAIQFRRIWKDYEANSKYSITFVEFAGITKDNVDCQDSRKRTKINIAAKDGHVSVVTDLIKFGANPNIIDKDKFSALGLAVRENHDTIAMWLLNWK